MTTARGFSMPNGIKPGHTVTDETPAPPPSPMQVRETITQVSPEGSPGTPGLRGKGILGLIAIGGGMVLLVAVILGLATGEWPIALIAALIGLLMLLVANPVSAAAIFRAREREEVAEQLGEKPPTPPDDSVPT